MDKFIRDLLAHWFVSSSLLERPDDNPTKTGEQYSKCGKIKASVILIITSGGISLQTPLRAATLTLTLLQIDLTQDLKIESYQWLDLLTSYSEPPPRSISGARAINHDNKRNFCNQSTVSLLRLFNAQQILPIEFCTWTLLF